MSILKRFNKRMIAWLLTAAMIAPMFPMDVAATASGNALKVAATASDNALKKETKSVAAAQLENYQFDSFEGLKKKISNADTEYTYLEYVGEDALHISGDLRIPSCVILEMGDKELVVDSGVTFSAPEIHCDKLNVLGNFELGENIYMDYPYELSGVKNIKFPNEWNNVWVYIKYTNAKQLKSRAEDLCTNYINHENVRYSFIYEDENGRDPSKINVVLNEDIYIPKHARLELGGPKSVTVAENNKLSVDGEMHIGTAMTVNGKLVNDGYVSMYSHDGKLTLKSSKSYSGVGCLEVYGDKDPLDVKKVIITGDGKFPFSVSSYITDDGRYNYEVITYDAMELRGEFMDFASLKKLVNNDEVKDFYRYIGTEPLIISETITIPEDIYLDACGADIKINKGVTFSVNNLECNNLNVQGTLNAKKRLRVEESVTVSGKIKIEDGFKAGSKLDITSGGSIVLGEYTINMAYPASINGIDNIQFSQEWQTGQIEARFKNAKELKSLANQISKNHIEHERVRYDLWYEYGNGDSSKINLVLDTDIEIPPCANLGLSDFKSVTLAKGTTLTINRELNVDSLLKIQGTLKNNGKIHVNGYGGGKLEFADGSNYAGSGEIYINGGSNHNDVTDIVTGNKFKELFDVSDYYVDPEGNPHWQLKYAKGLKKLATPTELSWGWRYEEQWNEDPKTGEWIITGYNKKAVNGSISWKTARPDQAEAQILIYRVGESTPCWTSRWGFGENVEPQYRTVDIFEESDLESGTYYFTVQSLGDHKTYRNSDVAVSGEYVYVKPDKKLPTCQNLKWIDRYDMFAGWTDWDRLADKTYVDGYQVKFYFSKTLNGKYEQYSGGSSRNYYDVDDIQFELDDWIIQEKGVGYYKFKVRALSNNIEVMCNGDWSELSPALDVKTVVKKVENNLSNLLSDIKDPSVNVNVSDIAGIVQNMGTDQLKTALLTDQDNSGTTKMLSQLEKLSTGGKSTPINVSKDAKVFDASKVSIVGANLNLKKSENKLVSLEIDKPERKHVIPELYDSAVAVSFSMTLGNVIDTEYLQVPVKITLPVPKNINPDFLVIFHYHADGSHEMIEPHVYRKDGMYYADFVLTSFSDFIMTQKVENKKKPHNSDKIEVEEEHVCIYDQEVATDVYLNTPATTTQRATYFKSCVCTGKGTELFEYGEKLKVVPIAAEKTTESVSKEEIEEEILEETVEETVEETKQPESTVEIEEVELEISEETEDEGKAVPITAITVIAAFAVVIAVSLVVFFNKRKKLK